MRGVGTRSGSGCGRPAIGSFSCRSPASDEALAACRPTQLPTPAPVILRGRAAWVEHTRGNVPLALKMMREVLAGDRDYVWGWRQLANWCDAAEEYSDYLDAADNLVRLLPRDPEAFGYRGEARLHLGDRQGAKDDFRQAYRLDGQYAFAGLHLLDAQLHDNELDDAGETLSALLVQHDTALVRLRGIRLALKRDDPALADEHLGRALTDADAPVGLLQRATETLLTGRFTAVVDRVLLESLTDPARQPGGGAIVGRTADRGRRLDLRRPLATAPGAGRGRHAGVAGLRGGSGPAPSGA